MELTQTVLPLTWDSDFFGFKVAKIVPVAMDYRALNNVLKEQWSDGVRLIYWATDPVNQVAQDAAVTNGGFLADKKVVYRRETRSLQSGLLGNVKLVESLPKDYSSVEVEALALQIGHYSRFKVDAGFPVGAWENLYKLWMQKSIDRTIADDVLVIRDGSVVAGIVTIRVRDEVGEIGLLGVLEKYRGNGYGAALLSKAVQCLEGRGVAEVTVVTQGDNKASRGLYENAGFSLSAVSNFYHFWSPINDSI